MQASKFLSMGKSRFYVVVMHGMAVHYELDGSIALFETSSLADGVYDENYEPAQEEITQFYEHLISETVPHLTVDARSLTLGALHYIEKHETFPILDAPKLTKAAAEALTKANETLTFYIDNNSKQTVFLCFGARLPIIDFLESQDVISFSCTALNFYYASNFRGAIYNLIVPKAELLLLHNLDKTCGGIIFSIDMIKFDEYRRQLQQLST